MGIDVTEETTQQDEKLLWPTVVARGVILCSILRADLRADHHHGPFVMMGALVVGLYNHRLFANGLMLGSQPAGLPLSSLCCVEPYILSDRSTLLLLRSKEPA